MSPCWLCLYTVEKLPHSIIYHFTTLPLRDPLRLASDRQTRHSFPRLFLQSGEIPYQDRNLRIVPFIQTFYSIYHCLTTCCKTWTEEVLQINPGYLLT